MGLRFTLVISWLVLVFSETINAQRGLGFLLNNARTFYETDKIVVVLAVYGIIGLLSDAFVRLTREEAAVVAAHVSRGR